MSNKRSRVGEKYAVLMDRLPYLLTHSNAGEKSVLGEDVEKHVWLNVNGQAIRIAQLRKAGHALWETGPIAIGVFDGQCSVSFGPQDTPFTDTVSLKDGAFHVVPRGQYLGVDALGPATLVTLKLEAPTERLWPMTEHRKRQFLDHLRTIFPPPTYIDG